MGICLKQLRSRVMPRNTSEKANMLIKRLTRGRLSPFSTQRNGRGYLTSINNIQLCPKTMATNAASLCWSENCHHHAYCYTTREGEANFSARALAYLVGKITQYAYACTEGLHFSAFHWVCLCVCVSVCLLSHISPTERLFILKTLSRTQRATKVKIFVGICLKRLCSRVMPRNMGEKANC